MRSLLFYSSEDAEKAAIIIAAKYNDFLPIFDGDKIYFSDLLSVEGNTITFFQEDRYYQLGEELAVRNRIFNTFRIEEIEFCVAEDQCCLLERLKELYTANYGDKHVVTIASNIYPDKEIKLRLNPAQPIEKLELATIGLMNYCQSNNYKVVGIRGLPFTLPITKLYNNIYTVHNIAKLIINYGEAARSFVYLSALHKTHQLNLRSYKELEQMYLEYVNKD